MSQSPFCLFIDTSAYLKSKLDFSDAIFTKLKLLIEEKKVHSLTSSIVKNELKKHIETTIRGDYKKINSACEKVDKLSLNLSSELRKIINIPTLDSFLDQDLERFDQQFQFLESEVLDHNILDINVVFDNYFEGIPPFSEKKKEEFPDAIVLNTILSTVGKNDCHIISTDPDWKAFCNLHDNLIYYDSIGAFINYCNEQGVAVTKEIQDAIKQKKNDITNYIQEQVKDYELSVSLDFNIADDIAEITSEVECAYESDFNVIDINEDKCSCTIDVNCLVSFMANVTGNDYNTALYDKEDNSWYFMDDVNLDISIERKFNIQITASYNYDENHKLYLEVDEIDGVDPITIEYTDYDSDYPLYK